MLDAQVYATRYTEVWNVPICLKVAAAQVAGIAATAFWRAQLDLALLTPPIHPPEVKLAAVFPPASKQNTGDGCVGCCNVWNDETCPLSAEGKRLGQCIYSSILTASSMRHRIAADRTPPQNPSFDF